MVRRRGARLGLGSRGPEALAAEGAWLGTPSPFLPRAARARQEARGTRRGGRQPDGSGPPLRARRDERRAADPVVPEGGGVDVTPPRALSRLRHVHRGCA